MTFLKYSNFLFKSMLTKWSIYITVILYYVLLVFFMYILPILLKMSLLQIFTLKTLLMLVILFAVFACSTIAIQLYRSNIDDGTDLLILSKPLSRSTIIWTKLFVLLMSYVIVSIISGLLACFTLISPYNTDESAYAIIFGCFLGTLLIFSVWGSIVSVVAVFGKKMTCLLVAIGLQAFVIVLSIVYSVAIHNPVNSLKNKNNLSMVPICLISKEENHKSNYEWGVLLENNTNKKFLNSYETKTNSTNDENDYLVNLWNNYTKNSNYNVVHGLDFDYQFASMLSLYTPKMVDKINVGDNINSFYDIPLFNTAWNLNFTSVNLHKEIKKINSPIVNYLDNNFVLVRNQGLEINKFNNVSIVKSKTKVPGSSGTIEMSKNFSLTLPNLKTSDLSFETFNNLKDFAKNYFSNEQINKVINFVNSNNNSSSNLFKISYASYYFSEISSAYLTKNNLIPLKNNNNFYKKIASLLNNLLSNFQYATYLTLSDYLNEVKSPKNLDFNTLNVLFSILNFNLDDDYFTNQINNNVYVYLGNFNNFNKIVNNTTPNGILLKNNWYKINPTYGLIPENSLNSFTRVSFSNPYSNTLLCLLWAGFAILMFLISSSLYSQRDFL